MHNFSIQSVAYVRCWLFVYFFGKAVRLTYNLILTPAAEAIKISNA